MHALMGDVDTNLGLCTDYASNTWKVDCNHRDELGLRVGGSSSWASTCDRILPRANDTLMLPFDSQPSTTCVKSLTRRFSWLPQLVESLSLVWELKLSAGLPSALELIM